MKKAGISRRSILKGGLSSAASLSLRSMATGVPASFILSGAMPARAAIGDARGLILAMSDDGESINCNGPGMYTNDSGDPRFGIDRVAEFSEPTNIRLGDVSTQAAQVFGSLPQALLDRMSLFNLRTHANGHPDGSRVRSMNGILRNANGSGVEEIQAAILQEVVSNNINNSSTIQTPMVLQNRGILGTIRSQGVPLSKYRPQDVRDLYLGQSTTYDLNDMKRLYDSSIDMIYKEVKANGTPAQKKYLDQHASTRTQSANLGDQLGALLTDVSGNEQSDQIRAAVAMMKVNLTPVVVIQYAYSKDNHGDVNTEIDLTNTAVANLTLMWDLLQTHGLTDQVNYATWDIFGRTTRINGEGGRDHHNSHCVNMMVGANIKAGIVGGYEHHTRSGTDEVKASGINSTTGLANNPDIPGDETLSAYGRTLMASMGIPEERIGVRIPHSKTVAGALL